jgi:hypothetical protein
MSRKKKKKKEKRKRDSENNSDALSSTTDVGAQSPAYSELGTL